MVDLLRQRQKSGTTENHQRYKTKQQQQKPSHINTVYGLSLVVQAGTSDKQQQYSWHAVTFPSCPETCYVSHLISAVLYLTCADIIAR